MVKVTITRRNGSKEQLDLINHLATAKVDSGLDLSKVEDTMAFIVHEAPLKDPDSIVNVTFQE